LLQSSPVEPFGGTDDFDVSRTHVIYTTKDPVLPEAWHTKQNVSISIIKISSTLTPTFEQVYVIGINGEGQRKELTSGKQGAIHSPVFDAQGTKAAWLELDKDGYESDRLIMFIFHLANC
jgi:hypothetical protein